jgi:hypothetical protein
VTRPQPAPLRDVVSSRRGSGCQHVNFPTGVAVLCGPKPYIDTLSCGHEAIGYSKAKRRRCLECLPALKLPLEVEQ